MFLKINGRDSEVADNANIREIVQASEFKDSLIVVKLNGQVTLRDAWERPLKPHDGIEIVRVIGGG